MIDRGIGENTIDLNLNCSKGLYLLKLKHDNEVKTIKLLKD
jgi:hypothetical protein